MKALNFVRSNRIILLAIFIIAVLMCLAFLRSPNKRRYKILMIGLDGASWKIALPLIKEGKLPNIKGLMDNGCWGNLKTFNLFLSEIIWTTIATGKPPHIHGITSNLMLDPDTEEMVPPTSNLRRAKAIWNILSEHKKKVGVVNYRVSWPAEKVNGVMISDRADDKKYFALHYSEPHFVTLCTEKIFNSFMEGKNSLSVLKGNSTLNRDIFMSNFTRYLLRNKNFDFFCLYLSGIDESSHYYWKYMFPNNQDIPTKDVLRYKDVIRDYYIWCDSVIGDLLKLLDKNTTVIIVSDHGFMTVPINSRYNLSKVDDLLEVSGLKKFKHKSYTVMLKNKVKDPAFFIKNIEITGDFSKEEFNAIRENTKDILKNIRVKETDQPLFKISRDTKNGFLLEADAEYINRVREYHILINGQEYKILDFMTSDPSVGVHDVNDAIIIMSGKNIRRHQELQSASIHDITPTVLYLLGLPIAIDMPGKVLAGTIDGLLLNRNPIRYIDTYEGNIKQTSQKPIRSPVDEEKIKEKMRSLGYIN